MHGRAFHDPNFKGRFVKNIIYHRTEEGTIEYYKNKGYSCLVIWDYELKNLDKAKNKLIEFNIIKRSLVSNKPYGTG